MILHVIIIMPNTAEDALNAFENRYCAEISEKLLQSMCRNRCLAFYKE